MFDIPRNLQYSGEEKLSRQKIITKLDKHMAKYANSYLLALRYKYLPGTEYSAALSFGEFEDAEFQSDNRPIFTFKKPILNADISLGKSKLEDLKVRYSWYSLDGDQSCREHASPWKLWIKQSGAFGMIYKDEFIYDINLDKEVVVGTVGSLLRYEKGLFHLIQTAFLQQFSRLPSESDLYEFFYRKYSTDTEKIV